jgi:gas vesicle protein
LIGGAVGAITALLFAPKSGKELRRDIADTSAELYDKTADIVHAGKQKAHDIIETVKHQADSLLRKSTDFYDDDMKEQIITSTDSVQQRFDSLKEATKAGAEAFKAELKK